MAERAAQYGAVQVDFGTGDGVFVHRAATIDARLLAIGVDANADNLRDSSRRAARKPARGGAPNALFGRMSLEEAPGELTGLADLLTVMLPWGSLLKAVALPEEEALRRLAAICKPGGRVRVVFGYDRALEAAAVGAQGLPALEEVISPAGRARLARRYREAGLEVEVRPLGADELRLIPSTWARKLSAPGARPRPFVEVAGHRLSRLVAGSAAGHRQDTK